MNNQMEILFTILFTLLIALIIFVAWLIIDWWTHVMITKSDSRIYGYAKYKDFVREFKKHNWSIEGRKDKYLWDRVNDCTIHANIVKMNGIGMVMRTPWDWQLVKGFVKEYIKVKYPLYDWSKTE